MGDYTFDTFLDEHLSVAQNKTGYRFSIDAVILAAYARKYPADLIVDLGTGCGIIPLILAYREPNLKIFGIELQKELADIASSNVKENHMGSTITILRKDLKELKNDMISGPVDLILSNPPYRKAESGRINPDIQRALARHEITVCLEDITQTVFGIHHVIA